LGNARNELGDAIENEAAAAQNSYDPLDAVVSKSDSAITRSS